MHTIEHGVSSQIPQSPRPSLSSARMPCSSHSAFVTQNCSLSIMISASTAPPRKTMCFRRGGSSIRILKFCGKADVSIPLDTLAAPAKLEQEYMDKPSTEMCLHPKPLSNTTASSPFLVSRASRDTWMTRQKGRCACTARIGCLLLLAELSGKGVLRGQHHSATCTTRA